MRQCTCKQCGRTFLENDTNPNIHYSIPSDTCLHCEGFNKLEDGDWYQAADGNYYQKGESEEAQRKKIPEEENIKLRKAVYDLRAENEHLKARIAELEAYRDRIRRDRHSPYSAEIIEEISAIEDRYGIELVSIEHHAKFVRELEELEAQVEHQKEMVGVLAEWHVEDQLINDPLSMPTVQMKKELAAYQAFMRLEAKAKEVSDAKI